MAGEAVLSVRGLTKRFGSLVAVEDLSLDVVEGEVFGFLGPNGAGKTTSIGMMCGLVRPDAGQVLVRGQPISSDRATRRQVGVCPQDLVIWPRLTCVEQLVFMAQMYDIDAATARRAADRLLDELDLGPKRDAQARTLSGGMKRRLNIALALVHDPAVVVFDEPEAGLDPQSRVRVREYIQSLARRKTVILTTHNMDEAERVADRIAIIDRGRRLALDTPAALKRSVGEGDVVEIGVDPGAADFEAHVTAARAALGDLVATVEYDAALALLRVRALDAVGKLARILEILERTGLRAGDVRVRENTLEDVFIQLTGRRLRE